MEITVRWVLSILLLISVPGPQGSTHTIHKQGNFDLISYQAIDIDEGDSWVDACADCEEQPLLTSFKGSDFMFQVVGKRQYLHPQHKARLASGITRGTAYEGCARATYAKGKLRIDTLPPKSVICVITDKGRFSEVTIGDYDPQIKRLSFFYITWEKETVPLTTKPSH
jgi:hypothetical protein